LQDPVGQEAALVARSKEGDLAAFNALVEVHQGRVYNLCLRMLASPEAAEDAAQDAFLSAYRNIERFRGASFRAWLLRIAANACTDELRRRRRRPQVSLDAEPATADGPLEPPDTSDSPEEWALRREMNRHIQDGLMKLPLDQRVVVVLCDVQGLSYEEIAETLAVSIGTVKSRISRGRARLRHLLLEREELLPRRFRHTK
jgi:RNA polymerase sigma factor (sigma-70 family)